MLSSCPFCHLCLPFQDLEWHVNNHLVEDEFEKDIELAQQIALAPPSPQPTDEPRNYMESSDIFPTSILECSTSSFNYMADCREIRDQERISCLVTLQVKSTIYKIEGGFMALLRRCLELEKKNSKSVISGYIDHYQSIKSEDSGWGCGWRNIQMLSSHLLQQRQEARETMFGGSGFVPDIPSLQSWLEFAWERGFDTVGSHTFAKKIYGSTKWIGTTECATLFRSFGLRARVVDFDNQCYTTGKLSAHRGKRTLTQVYGPMDKFLFKEKYDGVQLGSLGSANSQDGAHNLASLPKNSSTMIDGDSFSKFERKVDCHQVLVEWVWNYFTSDVSSGLDNFGSVLTSKKMPLYFQHDGHSRTIVGIQMQNGLRGLQNLYTLLVLDPGQQTAELERSLRDNTGWQKLVKRGVRTLKKPQYQLCYVDPGIARGEEMEQLKTIDSILVKL